MQIKLDTVGDQFLSAELKILTAFQKTNTAKPTAKKKKTEDKADSSVSIDHWSDKGLKEEYDNLKATKNYKAAKDETLSFTGATGESVWVIGLGDKSKITAEDIRKSVAKAFKAAKASKFENIALD